jgi:hypothetical protein
MISCEEARQSTSNFVINDNGIEIQGNNDTTEIDIRSMRFTYTPESILVNSIDIPWINAVSDIGIFYNKEETNKANIMLILDKSAGYYNTNETGIAKTKVYDLQNKFIGNITEFEPTDYILLKDGSKFGGYSLLKFLAMNNDIKNITVELYNEDTIDGGISIGFTASCTHRNGEVSTTEYKTKVYPKLKAYVDNTSNCVYVEVSNTTNTLAEYLSSISTFVESCDNVLYNFYRFKLDIDKVDYIKSKEFEQDINDICSPKITIKL